MRVKSTADSRASRRARGLIFFYLGQRLAGLADEGDHRLHGHRRALAREDLQHRALEETLHLHGGLVGLDLEEDIPLRDRIPLLLQPLQNGAFLRELTRLRHGYRMRHDIGPPVRVTRMPAQRIRRAAATMSWACGRNAASRMWDCGAMPFFAPTRMTGRRGRRTPLHDARRSRP
jgi:hypothetical protein